MDVLDRARGLTSVSDVAPQLNSDSTHKQQEYCENCLTPIQKTS